MTAPDLDTIGLSVVASTTELLAAVNALKDYCADLPALRARIEAGEAQLARTVSERECLREALVAVLENAHRSTEIEPSTLGFVMARLAAVR